MKTINPQLMIYGAAAAVGLYLAYKLTNIGGAVADALPGIVSGDNKLTQNQTNAAGEKTTAYQGAGIAGTVGAATNTASGGALASVGEAIGGWWASVTGADKDAEIAAMLKGGTIGAQQTAQQSQYNKPPMLSGTQTFNDGLQDLSILTMRGTSPKDSAARSDINPFSTADTYGGGLSLR
jgi:hypothetical protein